MRRICIATYAKVNLSLEVLGKRPDGFHEVRSVMQSISLRDELAMEPAPTLSLQCDLPHLSGDDNLVIRAARALQGLAGRSQGARIRLAKGIPEAAGLGGASADAAATLVGLDHLWGLGLSVDRLEEVASTLGSDVPFFLFGGTALVSGRGELVSPLPDAPPNWLVLLVSEHSLAAKTATLYHLLGPESWTSGERTERLVEAFTQLRPLEDDLLGNAFESVADRAFPGLLAFREAMLAAGAQRVHLSGAGPALFSLFPGESAARAVASRLAGRGHQPLIARTLPACKARLRPATCDT